MEKEITVKHTELTVDGLSLKVGDFLIGSHHYAELFEILSITEKDEIIRFECLSRHNNERERSLSISDIKQYYKVLSGVEFEEIEQYANDIINGDIDFDSLIDNKATNKFEVLTNNQHLYEKSLIDAKQLNTKLLAIRNSVKAKTEKMRASLDLVIREQNKLIRRLNSIVFTLEIYSGIDEEVKQIQSGAPAFDDTPIYLCQLMKFMDEEVGDPDNGGVSYDSVDVFYDWMVKYSSHLKCFNYELLLPFKKCVRTLRVRRNTSERYSLDPFNNRWRIEQEMNTFLLIRNGENIYVIDSKMSFNKKLYPDKKELTEIFNLNDEDEVFDSLQGYKNGMVIIQGLIDRTDVFGDISNDISVLSTKSQEEGKVIFNYEMDENLITDGSKTFLDFLQTDDVKHGDRILLINAYSHPNKFLKWYDNEYACPPSPKDGIYKVENIDGSLCIKYLPDDDVYNSSTGYMTKRKNRVSYRINPKSDHNIVNIDRVSHRDIDWLSNMMYDRRDRRKYLRVNGLLKALKRFKNLELKEEESFVRMLQSYTSANELTVLDAVHWWKTKNMHKRALTVDDKKAFRMIVKKLNKDE